MLNNKTKVYFTFMKTHYSELKWSMLITLLVGSSVTVNNISSSKLLNIVKKKKLIWTFSIHFFFSRNNGNTFGALEQSIFFVGLSFKENIILLLLKINLLHLFQAWELKRFKWSLTSLKKKWTVCLLSLSDNVFRNEI